VKKVLILTYYWPPSGGAGVQRWLKFVKYLRQFGWEPIVYTAENPEYPVLDNSLEKDIPEGIEILKHPIWEPYQLYKRFIGQKIERLQLEGTNVPKHGAEAMAARRPKPEPRMDGRPAFRGPKRRFGRRRD
jgi:hypothetical protein